MAEVILKNLKKVYPNTEKKKKAKKGEPEKKTSLQITDEGVVAVQDFNLHIADKEFIVLVGPSGCGKSTTLRMIAGLEDISGGELYIGGKLMNDVEPKDRDIAMVFQSYALYPHMTVYENMAFSLKLKKLPKDEIDQRVRQAAEILDITQYLDRKPKALSGGQRQRLGIARALACNPELIVCDEPVSALDVSIQAQILNLLMDLQDELGITYMFITHNMSVVRHISHNICVMYLGQLVETSPTKELLSKPLHPYTKALLSAIPSTDIHHKKERIILKGELVSPIDPKPGCRFATRCPYACEACSQPQELREVLPGHYVSCCRVEELENL